MELSHTSFDRHLLLGKKIVEQFFGHSTHRLGLLVKFSNQIPWTRHHSGKENTIPFSSEQFISFLRNIGHLRFVRIYITMDVNQC